MLKNSGSYAKTFIALMTYLAGVVPVVTTFHTWQQIVSYVVPGVLAVLGVYVVPNKPALTVTPPAAEDIANSLHLMK